MCFWGWLQSPLSPLKVSSSVLVGLLRVPAKRRRAQGPCAVCAFGSCAAVAPFPAGALQRRSPWGAVGEVPPQHCPRESPAAAPPRLCYGGFGFFFSTQVKPRKAKERGRLLVGPVQPGRARSRPPKAAASVCFQQQGRCWVVALSKGSFSQVLLQKFVLPLRAVCAVCVLSSSPLRGKALLFSCCRSAAQQKGKGALPFVSDICLCRLRSVFTRGMCQMLLAEKKTDGNLQKRKLLLPNSCAEGGEAVCSF